MAYRKLSIKGRGKEHFQFVGVYIGKFERIGSKQLVKVDELRTSKGSQLKNHFQLWHTQRNQYIFKILHKNSQWEVLILESINEVRTWLANDTMYDDLARYAAQIHELPDYALPRIANLKQYRTQKVLSAHWRKPYEVLKVKASDRLDHLGDYDVFTYDEAKKIEHRKVTFFSFQDDMIEKLP